MIKKNWALTHPYGKNKIWRTIKWGLQRFWRGWDETMPDNFENWLYEFMPQACEERKLNGWTLPYNPKTKDSYTEEDWYAELDRGAELFKKANHVYWNRDEDWKPGDDIMKSYNKDQAVKKEALMWLVENVGNFND